MSNFQRSALTLHLPRQPGQRGIIGQYLLYLVDGLLNVGRLKETLVQLLHIVGSTVRRLLLYGGQRPNAPAEQRQHQHHQYAAHLELLQLQTNRLRTFVNTTKYIDKA